MHAECRGFFKNLLNKLKICFVYSNLVANNSVFQKVLKHLTLENLALTGKLLNNKYISQIYQAIIKNSQFFIRSSNRFLEHWNWDVTSNSSFISSSFLIKFKTFFLETVSKQKFLLLKLSFIFLQLLKFQILYIIYFY